MPFVGMRWKIHKTTSIDSAICYYSISSVGLPKPASPRCRSRQDRLKIGIGDTARRGDADQMRRIRNRHLSTNGLQLKGTFVDIEKMRVQALNQCIDIANDFTEEEVKKFCPPSVRAAWKIGNEFIQGKMKENRAKRKNFKL